MTEYQNNANIVYFSSMFQVNVGEFQCLLKREVASWRRNDAASKDHFLFYDLFCSSDFFFSKHASVRKGEDDKGKKESRCVFCVRVPPLCFARRNSFVTPNRTLLWVWEGKGASHNDCFLSFCPPSSWMPYHQGFRRMQKKKCEQKKKPP